MPALRFVRYPLLPALSPVDEAIDRLFDMQPNILGKYEEQADDVSGSQEKERAKVVNPMAEKEVDPTANNPSQVIGKLISPGVPRVDQRGKACAGCQTGENCDRPGKPNAAGTSEAKAGQPQKKNRHGIPQGSEKKQKPVPKRSADRAPDIAVKRMRRKSGALLPAIREYRDGQINPKNSTDHSKNPIRPWAQPPALR